MKIIEISGKKRSGKDYIAQYMHISLPNSYIIHFADKLKEMVAQSLGISVEILDNLKNSNYTIQLGQSKTTMRYILQHFGTEVMQKEFGKYVWVDIVKKEIEKSNYDYVIIPDFRFKHEYIKDSTTIKIINTNQICDDLHRSEIDLDDFSFDYIIHNNMDNSFKDEVDLIINKLRC